MIILNFFKALAKRGWELIVWCVGLIFKTGATFVGALASLIAVIWIPYSLFNLAYDIIHRTFSVSIHDISDLEQIMVSAVLCTVILVFGESIWDLEEHFNKFKYWILRPLNTRPTATQFDSVIPVFKSGDDCYSILSKNYSTDSAGYDDFELPF